MEALEDKYTKRDSFDEVDRILTIVEESKREFDKGDKAYSLFMYSLFCIIALIISFLIYFFFNGDKIKSYEQAINQENGLFNISSLLFSAIGVFIVFRLTKILDDRKKKEKEFLETTAQATEVLREIVPALSRSERWSVLQKFELRLRLSRLGISVDKIFEPEM